MREGFVELLQALAPVQAILDPLARLREIGRRYVRFGLERPETYRLIFMENLKLSNEVIGARLQADGEPGERAFTLLEATVRELVDAKRFRPIDPENVAEILWAGVHGLVSLRVACDLTAGTFFGDIELQTELMLDTMERGFGA